MAQLGYVEGGNLSVERRFAHGHPDRLPKLAAELVALKPDVLVTVSTPATRAAKEATSSLPIVFIGLSNPVDTGLIAGYAQPGGNVTGASLLAAELGAKWVELLREFAPGVKKIAFLNDVSNVGSVGIFEHLRDQALRIGVAVQQYDGGRR